MTSAAHSGCDAGLAWCAPAGSAARHPWLVLITSILASSLAMVDESVINVGLPAIGRSLHAGPADLQWIINAYLLPLSALLLLGGGLGDRFGRRRLLMAGVLVFAAASTACAFAPDIGWLLAGRAVQGVGAALLPLPLVLVVASPAMGAMAGRVGARRLLAAGSLIVAGGLLLTFRIRPGAHYWTTVLPVMLCVSAGMSAVAAPLTTAVLASVDSRHAGSASGLNSALSRTGGLIATALLGAVLAGRGALLIEGFRSAAILGALAAAASAAFAFLFIDDGAGGPKS
jgi:MFS family permease